MERNKKQDGQGISPNNLYRTVLDNNEYSHFALETLSKMVLGGNEDARRLTDKIDVATLSGSLVLTPKT